MALAANQKALNNEFEPQINLQNDNSLSKRYRVRQRRKHNIFKQKNNITREKPSSTNETKRRVFASQLPLRDMTGNCKLIYSLFFKIIKPKFVFLIFIVFEVELKPMEIKTFEVHVH